MALIVLFAGNTTFCKQVISQVSSCVAAFFGDSVTLKNLAKCSEDNLYIAKEGDFLDVFEVVTNFCFPGDCVATADLSKPAEPLAYGMAFTLFGGHKDHITNKLRSRSDYGHVALEDVDEFREFVEARAAEKLAVGIQANIVREQVAVGVLLVRHRAELDELEDFFVKARARLHKERIALHLDGAEDGEHDENRTQADDGCQSAEEVERAFEESSVHYANSLDPSTPLTLRSG